jgi:hypothetical protein
LCVGPAIQAEHLNGIEFACPSVACLSGSYRLDTFVK